MGDAFTQLKTDDALLRKLSEHKKPTPEDVREQRVSFVFGTLDADSPMTREQVRRLVEEEV